MTAVNSALNSALSGIQKGLESAANRAERISNASAEPSSDSYTNDLIGFKLDLYQVSANRKVVSVVEEMDKSVLDILA